MQIIEVTDWGARSAVLRLQRRGTPLRFILFPMVHLADPRFYAAVQQRLRTCDLIVAEGIRGKSTATRAMTRSYRFLRHKSSLGMVVQDIDYAALGVPVLYPDMTGRQLDRSWRTLPWVQRLTFAVLVPAFIGWMLLFGTRRVLASHLAQDDLPSDVDTAIAETLPQFEKIIGGDRDQLLLEALMRIHEQHCAERIDVAVVYGAAHIPVITHNLLQHHRYFVRSAEWLTLFTV